MWVVVPQIRNEEKDVSLSGWTSPINEKCSDYRRPELLFGLWKTEDAQAETANERQEGICVG
jgi:hypothetical protein